MNEKMNFTPPENYEDQSKLLLIGGIGGIILAFLSLLLAGFSVLPLVIPIPQQQTVNTLGTVVSGLAMYSSYAIVFFILGIGSIMAKRWARALMLTISWVWLAMGGVTIIMFLFMYPIMKNMMQSGGKVPSELTFIFLLFVIVFIFILFVILPGGFVMLYRNPDVKATCEAMNPNECWTDRCPLPVLAVSVLLLMCLPNGLSIVFIDFAAPFWGTMLRGIPGAVIWFVLLIAVLYSVIGFYKLKLSAWWCLFTTIVLFSLSGALTFFNMDVSEFSKIMCFSPKQVEMLEASGDGYMQLMMLSSLISGGALSGYLIFVKKYFVKPVPAEKELPKPGESDHHEEENF